MKKTISVLLSTCLVLSLAACSKSGGDVKTLTGTGKGYGGDITVTVTKEGDKITKVEAKGDKETPAVGGKAITDLPAKIVAANSADVDVIAGATVTSRGIIYAVKNALDPKANPWPMESNETPGEVGASDVFLGFGMTSTGRKGPGSDDKEVQVWSFNQVLASALFDGDGKILYLKVDQVEVATPNYDGDGMPHLSGFPGQGGYNFDSDHDEKIDSMTEDTEDNYKAEINLWQTKRQRGDNYKVGIGTWSSQMNAFEKLFVGKTVKEVEDWFKKYTSDRNGRPLKDGAEDAADKAKYDALTADDKAMLADVTTSATMSLKDGHGDIIGAIKEAYEKKMALKVTEAESMGLGVSFTPRIGPGKDSTETQVYSFNQVYATTLFDKDGKIVAIHVDQLEVATPNYDGEGMPHFSGFPGQGGYNYDENHDEKIEGKTADTEENFFAEVESWVTKRDRGEGYKVGIGTWTSQMDAFEKLFIGKTVTEVEDWFKKYTSDRNGRPLKDGAEDAADKAKYDALTAAEKAMLADVTASATMSLNDGHGDIVKAIKASFESKVTINLKVK